MRGPKDKILSELPVSRRGLIGAALAGSVALGLEGGEAARPGAMARAGAGASLFRDDFRPIAGWKRHGVILRQDLPWESALLQDPCLVYRSGEEPLFKMWYGSLTNIGYATSEDGMAWTKRPDPIVTQTLASEAKALNQPSVVHRAGVWHMTYFGVDATGQGQIHYATAARPEGPWTKHGVALTATMPWEDRFIYNSSLLYDEEERIWKLWYTAGKIKSAGGEPRYICYATARDPAGPWEKYAGNPILRPMDDGGWASLGIGGPNVRKLGPNRYETRVVGWQADYPSRGGKLLSRDGKHWMLDRSAMELDLGIVGGPEDSMIYRQFIVAHGGRDFCFYNAKNNRPGWNETINLATWEEGLDIVDPALWTMGQGAEIPTGASFAVKGGRLHALGNAGDRAQTLQGNRRIERADYAVRATIIPEGDSPADREAMLLARCTDRRNHYYAGIGLAGHAYAIGLVEDGVDRLLAGTGRAEDIAAGTPHALTFELRGAHLSLLDGGRPVLSVIDPTLQPAASYAGLQANRGSGRVSFAALAVEAR